MGIGIQAERVALRGRPASGFLLRRFAILLAIRILHLVLIWNRDILCLYAVCGLLVIPALRLPEWLLVCAGLLAIAFNFAPFSGSFTPSGKIMRAHAASATPIYASGSFPDILALRWRETWKFMVPLLVSALPKTPGLMLLGVATWQIPLSSAALPSGKSSGMGKRHHHIQGHALSDDGPDRPGSGTRRPEHCRRHVARPLRAAGPHPTPGMPRAACQAHVRRKFFEGAKAGCLLCARLLRIINVLYRIEGRARELGLEPEHRALLRRSRARCGVAGLRRRIDRTLLAERPQNPVGKACAYALGQWPGLLTYLDHGDVEIDNNSVENAIRPCALGKKNWLFTGDVKAGPRGAVFYSLPGSCLRRGLNLRAYLHWLFTRIAAAGTHAPHTLTPAAYAVLTAPVGKTAQAA